ncbi:hypothetical protein H4S08_003008 [Coemansia sp. RSA 1365]|nr:hypothetical protein H4S08_003008 [Coemansia sp. RSA 1365]
MTSPRQTQIMPVMSRSARRSPLLIIQPRLVPRQQQCGDIPNTQHPSNCQFNNHVRINYAAAYRSLSNPAAQDNAAAVSSQPLLSSTSNPAYNRRTLTNIDSPREFVAPAFVSSPSNISSGMDKESGIKLPPISEIIGSIDHNKISPLTRDDNSQHHPVKLAQTAHTCFASNVWDCQQYPRDVSSFAY